MRIKSLILSAMVGIAGITTSLAAPNVYSINVVGYINLDVPAGFTIIANQLDNGNGNLVIELLANPPLNSTFYKFNGSGYDQVSFIGIWLGDTAMTLEPGEGAFVQVAAAETLTFVGEVKQGQLDTALSTGFDIYSSQVPQTGLLATDLGYAPAAGDNIYQWNGAGYDQSSFVGIWLPGEPTVEIGEAFWIQSADDKMWSRTFNID